jgi:hypothetical protein
MILDSLFDRYDTWHHIAKGRHSREWMKCYNRIPTTRNEIRRIFMEAEK